MLQYISEKWFDRLSKWRIKMAVNYSKLWDIWEFVSDKE